MKTKERDNGENKIAGVAAIIVATLALVFLFSPLSLEGLTKWAKIVEEDPFQTAIPYFLLMMFSVFIVGQLFVLITKSKLGTRRSAHSREEGYHSKEIALNFIFSLSITLAVSTVVYMFLKLGLIDVPSYYFDHLPLYSYALVIGYGAVPGTLWFTYVQWISRIFKKENKEDDIVLPPYPNEKNSIVLGSTCEDPSFDQSDMKDLPYWVKIGLKTLKENILILGQIGSGKTSSATIPIVTQILMNFSNIFLMVIDPKCTLIKGLIVIIKKLNLGVPIYHFKLDGDVLINFCKENALETGEYQEHASELLAATINYVGDEGGSNSNFWNYNTLKLYKSTLAYCYFKYNGYFTIEDFLNSLRNTMDESLQEDLDAMVEKETEDGSPSESYELEGESEAVKHNLLASQEFFNKEFSLLDIKVKTSILTTATTFLDQLTEYKASKVFSPKKEEVTISSFDEIVNKRGIFLFDIENEAIAKPMGTLVKLQFQKAVLNRAKRKDFEKLKSLLAVLLIEESQCVASGGGGAAMGDDRYLSMSREAGGVSIYISQSYSSLLNKIGKLNSFMEFIQNFRTVISFSGTDKKTAEEISRIAGKKEVKKRSVTINESMSNPNRNIFNSEFESNEFNLSESVSYSFEKIKRVEESDVAQLSKFEAFALISGARPKFYKLFCKPYFLEKKETLHKDVLKMVEEHV